MTLPAPDDPLPEDPRALQALVRELLDALAAERREGTALRTRLDQLLRRLYGPKSEKVPGATLPERNTLRKLAHDSRRERNAATATNACDFQRLRS